MSAIETLALTKTYGDGHQALGGLDLAVQAGELFALLGPNGAGKTTLVRILTTLLRSTGGHARILGYDVAREPDRVRWVIGVALQQAGLDPLATGRELLTLQARLFALDRKAAARRTDELLELVGLAEAADRRVGAYSGGMQRRLDLASALVHTPRVLFLDEPTTGLDPASRQEIWAEISRLNREQGTTVLLTTQYLEEADRLADRVAIIDNGQLVAEGAPEQLKATVDTDVVQLTLPTGQTDIAARALANLDIVEETRSDAHGLTVFTRHGTRAIPDLLRRLDHAGVHVEATTLTRPSLDDVFLKATGHRLTTDAADDDRAA